MYSFPFLALPPELRAKVYCHLLPTVAHPSAYLGLRLSCSTIRREFDHEALLRLRIRYQAIEATHPECPFTFDIPTHFKDIRTLKARTKSPTPEMFQGLVSYQLVPWTFRWLRNFTVIHVPSANDDDDDFVINAVCNGIVMSITWDHPCQPHRKWANSGNVDETSMLKRIKFKWDGDEELKQPVPDEVLPWLKTFKRRGYVSFMTFRTGDARGETTGYEWRRCRTWNETRPTIRFFVLFAFFIVMIVATMINLIMAASLMWRSLSS